MPRVTAIPRGQSNGEIITSFTDTVGTTSTTFTFDTQQEGLIIANKGLVDISFTINGIAYTVKPGKSQKVTALFVYFTIQSTNGVQQFEASAWDFEKNKTTIDILQEPFVIAHRGGASVYPENTMAAYRNCVANGVRAIEPDVQLLYDGAMAVMHDSTVDRTTSSAGSLSSFDSYSFGKLVVDASTWFTGGQDTTAPLFEDVLREFGSSVVYAPESKDQLCADKIAQILMQYGLKDNAIIQSFGTADLVKAVPYGIPTLLLTDSYDPTQAKKLGITYIGFSTSATDQYIQSILDAGLKPVVYEVSLRDDWNKWKAKGVVGCFSDDPVWLSGLLTPRKTDPFALKSFYHGQNAVTRSGLFPNRGVFVGTNRWGWTSSSLEYALQGWGSPVANAASTYSIQFTMTVESFLGGDTTRWGACAFGSPIDYFCDTWDTRGNAYQVLLRANGIMELYKIINGVSTHLGSVANSAIAIGGTATVKVDVTPTSITVTRTDVAAPNSVTANDTALRGGYWFLNHANLGVTFSNVSIT